MTDQSVASVRYHKLPNNISDTHGKAGKSAAKGPMLLSSVMAGLYFAEIRHRPNQIHTVYGIWSSGYLVEHCTQPLDGSSF